VLVVDRAQRDRVRALAGAKRYVAARAAQAELRRMGRDPGRLLGAVERLRRVKAEDTAAGGR
jgi:hypothetical protein